ncbi:hypothetical protein DWB77_00720 [Streptomyces hundungensis]|uniref:Lipoprotein n=1 Tax=Streptomyces hundungensis TaxID=1077946 RepID=A0A387HCY1_9ACTN|nr:hypothetical protein [Streptomyces hundungensis]AYG78612.1 hypothetical protein DWB77_00720 [Streptomyces hundungensis]
MTAAVRFARAAALAGCVMMLAAGCGGASGSAASDTETATSAPPSHTPAPPPDKGPPCEGSPTAKGLHVLRGGSEVLPGGAGPVLYKEGGSDGTHRTATLTNGTGTGTAQAGTESWPVRLGQALTVHGKAFTVSQICTYRVVLTPKDGTTVTQPPVPNVVDPKWPALTDGRLRLRWHVPNTEEHGAISAVLQDVAADPARADISVTSRAGGGGVYSDARVGDTLEFAGRLWKLTAIDTGDGDPSGANPNSGYVDLQLIGPSS